MKSLLVLFLSLLGLSAAAEELEIQSATYNGIDDFQQMPAGEVSLRGNLSLPEGAGKAAAVILLHTCNGPGTFERVAGDFLRQQGYATLEFDSLTPRGWRGTDVCGGKVSASTWSQLGDAYAALGALARHPGIDPGKISVIGGSMGAGSAFLASSEPLRVSVLGKDGPRFAAHVSFYTSGSAAFFGPGAHTGAPILLMVGERDDWAPARRVVAVANFLKQESPGLPIKVNRYDAGHSWVSGGSRDYSASRKSFSDCPYTLYSGQDFSRYLLTVDGNLSPTTGEEIRKVFSECRKPGATIEGSSEATRQSLADLDRFLRMAEKQ